MNNMLSKGAPWYYSEIDLDCFVQDELDKHAKELIDIYNNDTNEFKKKVRGIVIGVWQKKGAFGRIKREAMDNIIKSHIDFFCIEHDLKNV